MKTRFWSLLSLLLFLAAIAFWQLGERQRGPQQPPGAAGGLETLSPAERNAFFQKAAWPHARMVRNEGRAMELLSVGGDPNHPLRLQNSSRPAAELFTRESSVLLRNALIDTGEPLDGLNIPEHLRSAGDPGAWIVQAAGKITPEFRQVIAGAGAREISYVPHNALLVRASEATVRRMQLSRLVGAVVPYEPYYKLDETLLPLAVRREPVPPGRWLKITLNPDDRERGLRSLQSLGVEVLQESAYPFGHLVTVRPNLDNLVALARLPEVQNLEAWHQRVLLNDLSRERIGVSSNTTVAVNHLGLTGSGVTVGVIGGGVESTHAELAGRVITTLPAAATDPSGHDTHVAGIIAASGASSGSLTATNGSLSGASYRGMAPAAMLYPLDVVSGTNTDLQLQTNIARLTNIYVANNSWGYANPAYDSSSALWDIGVRDSMPHWSGDQSVTYVFAAGNLGGGTAQGNGGAANSIVSPGTAKNVVTVGALESLRSMQQLGTNANPFPDTDSDDQIAGFSSRGNVGIGIEGPYGRFKPDVVANGTYVASLRSSTFVTPTTNDSQLGSSQWRYESGTSMAAAAVSGMLALMQEYFTTQQARTNSPALNRALLINGARSAGVTYDYNSRPSINYQGWGVAALTNTLGPTVAAVTDVTPSATATVVYLDQSGLITNQIATGQTHAYDLAVAGDATNYPVRITLAWTDPPGNPVSSIKLVNDLDLIVTNITGVSSYFYEGNRFAAGNFTTRTETNQVADPRRDFVNNVENIYLEGPHTNVAGVSYRIYVHGNRVNVNAVTGNTNNVVQDYSLVVSTELDNEITLTKVAMGDTWTNRFLKVLTNGIPLDKERVGGNFQQVTVNTNGLTNQWNFYFFGNTSPPAFFTNTATNIIGTTTNITTNIIPALTNNGAFVAFSTFLPPNLAKSRNKEADIDMYVTRSGPGFAPLAGYGAITNLDPSVFTDPNTLRATNRGGFELVSFTNAANAENFIVAVKAEDQQAATYGLLAISSDVPFATTNTNGFIDILLFPVPADIPDGAPDSPGGVVLYGINTISTNVSGVSITNIIAHENAGDLVGTITHNGVLVTLNNHDIGAGPGALRTNNYYYDSMGRVTDGPGQLEDFIGQEASGLWLISLSDDAPNHTGYVAYASLQLGSRTNYNNNGNTQYTRTFVLGIGQALVDFFVVPVSATNMNVSLQNLPAPTGTPGTMIDLLAAYNYIPDYSNIVTSAGVTNGFLRADLNSGIPPPHLTVNRVTQPPLTAGPWWFRIVNNSSATQTLTLVIDLQLDLTVTDTVGSRTNLAVNLLDDYTTNVFLDIADNRVIAGVDVGIGVLHPRVSDLVFHLISPDGDKVLLMENRGGATGSNVFANFTENTNLTTSIVTDATTGALLHYTNLAAIKFVPAPFTNLISPPQLLASNLVDPGSLDLPNAAAVRGQSYTVVGDYRPSVISAAPWDGFLFNQSLPMDSNTVPVNWFTNWLGTPAAGRNGDTFFSGVASAPEGHVAVGQSRDYFLTAQNPVGGPDPDVYDLDANCTNGTLTINYTAFGVPDVWQVEYQGVVLTNTGLISGSGAITVNFAGSSSFLRVTVNPGGNPSFGTRWNYNVAVTCNQTVNFAVSTLVASGTLNNPALMTLGPDANLYVADSGNHVIRRVTPAGVVTTFAGTVGTAGSADGILTTATFNRPLGLVFDTSTNLYVTDTDNHTIRVIDVAGNVTTLAGTAGISGTADGAGAAARFNLPVGIAIDSQTNLYITDNANHTIRLMDTAGNVTTFAGLAGSTGSADGVGAVARFNFPNGIAVDGFDNIYVADVLNHTIRHVNTNGTVTTFAGTAGSSGTADGAGAIARFNRPNTVAANPGGTLYVSDNFNHTIRQISPSAVVITAAGSGGTAGNVDGNGNTARFNLPVGLVADGFSQVYISEFGNDTIRRMVSSTAVGNKDKAIAVFYQVSGPITTTNTPARHGAERLTRGITNNVFGIDRDDRFHDATVAEEGGTNYYYAVGSAKFSLGNDNEKLFVTKFRTNGLALWTTADTVASGNQRQAAATATLGAGGSIASIAVIDSGAGYAPPAAAPPAVTVSDDAGFGSGATATATVNGLGQVSGITVGAAGTGYVTPRVTIAPPPGYSTNYTDAFGVFSVAGTNVLVAGYTNSSMSPVVVDQPYLLNYTSNGVQRWRQVSANNGRYKAVTVVGTNVIAVGRTVTTSPATVDSFVERWDLDGNFLGTASFDVGGNAVFDELNAVVGFECPDRIYAIGTRGGAVSNAFLIEVDALTLTVISTSFLGSLGVVSTGVDLNTDGRDLYATLGYNTGTPNVLTLRYRIKNWYLPEESLDLFVGRNTWSGTNNQWRLQIQDNRAGGTNGVAQVLCWNLNFRYASTGTVGIVTIAPGLTYPITLLGNSPQYFKVQVPGAAGFVTNLVQAGNGALQMSYNSQQAPVSGSAGNVMLSAGGMSAAAVLGTNTATRLQPGGFYYLALQNVEGVTSNQVALRVDFDRLVPATTVENLTSGVALGGFIPPGLNLKYYQLNVPAGAAGARFELLPNLGDLNLYIRRDRGGQTLPTASVFDYRSLNPGALAETVFVVPDASSGAGLLPGAWFLGVDNPGSQQIFYTIKATALTGTPYAIQTLTGGVPVGGSSVVGNAPDTMHKLAVAGAPKALLFQVIHLGGNGDLIVGHGSFPAGTNYTTGSFTLDRADETISVRTNAGLPNLDGDWFFGVRNREITNLTYTAVAKLPATNGLLISERPIQLLGVPGQGLIQPNQGFGFDFGVVPGEKYRIEYSTNPASPNWLVLTNLVAPAGGALNFIHANALTNRGLYYRVQQVP